MGEWKQSGPLCWEARQCPHSDSVLPQSGDFASHSPGAQDCPLTLVDLWLGHKGSIHGVPLSPGADSTGGVPGPLEAHIEQGHFLEDQACKMWDQEAQ